MLGYTGSSLFLRARNLNDGSGICRRCGPTQSARVGGVQKTPCRVRNIFLPFINYRNIGWNVWFAGSHPRTIQSILVVMKSSGLTEPILVGHCVWMSKLDQGLMLLTCMWEGIESLSVHRSNSVYTLVQSLDEVQSQLLTPCPRSFDVGFMVDKVALGRLRVPILLAPNAQFNLSGAEAQASRTSVSP
jgi:hypothetical protein